MNKYFLLFANIFCIQLNLYAQYNFGKVSEKEIKETKCKLDGNASAAVLFDVGEFKPNEFRFYRAIRYKVYKKEALDIATQTFYIQDKDVTVYGYTYNLENDKVVKTKLEKNSYKIEREYGNLYSLKIAMPQVRVGSIFEIELSYLGYPKEWYFQRSIPVFWSELLIEGTNKVVFSKNLFGQQKINVLGDRYIGENIPAFQNLPYMNSFENYISKLEIDITRLTNSSSYYISNRYFASTWENVNSLLMSDEDLGLELKKNHKFITEESERILKMNLSDEEKIKQAYEFAHNINWNKNNRLFKKEFTLDDVYSKKSGNSAEINIILYLLLDKLNLNPEPIAMSTRDNGLISLMNPSINKLNHLIIRLQKDSNYMFLDASDEYATYKLLPIKALNYRGRLLNKKDSKANWAEIINNNKHLEKGIYNAKINSEGIVNILALKTYKDYAAYNFRKKYNSHTNQKDYLNSEYNNEGMSISEYELLNIDSLYKTVNEKINFKLTNQTTTLNNEILFNPLFEIGVETNTFKEKERTIPIDYIYPREYSYNYSIEIPEPYTIQTLPKSKSITLNEDEMIYEYNILKNEETNSLEVEVNFKINNYIYSSEDYENIKSFYNSIAELQKQMVSIKK